MSYLSTSGSTSKGYIGTGTQAATDYVTTYTPSTPILTIGLEIVFFPDANSVGNDTLNGVLIKKETTAGIVNLVAKDLIGGGAYNLIWNGTNWILPGGASSAGTYRVVQALVPGNNVITHNLGVSIVMVDVRDASNGDTILVKAVETSSTVVTINVFSGVASARITIQS